MLPRTRLHPFKETQKQSLQHYKDPVTECRIQPLNQAPFVQDSRRGHRVNGTSGNMDAIFDHASWQDNSQETFKRTRTFVLS